MSNLASNFKNDQIKIVVEEFKGMTANQKRNVHLNRNLGGAKLEKIIDDY